MSEIAQAVKGADKLILATDPDREGEAISWHILEMLQARKVLKGVDVKRVVFNEVTKQAVLGGDEAPARDQRASWSMPIWPAARSTISSASRSRRCSGASCPAPARPAACSRWRCASSASARTRSRRFKTARILDGRGDVPDGQGEELHRPPHAIPARLRSSTSRTTPTPRPQRRPRDHRPAIQGRRGRAQGGQAQSAAAVHHLDPAAGSLAQARASAPSAPCALRRSSTRASTSAARRSASSPTCEPTASTSPAGGGRRHARGLIARSYGQRIPARDAARLQIERQERPGSARGDPPDRRVAPARRRGAIPRYGREASLRADLEAHHRLEMESATLEQTAVDVTGEDRRTTLRATGPVILFDGFLKLYHEDRDDAPENSAAGEDDGEAILPRVERGEPRATRRSSPNSTSPSRRRASPRRA